MLLGYPERIGNGLRRWFVGPVSDAGSAGAPLWLPNTYRKQRPCPCSLSFRLFPFPHTHFSRASLGALLLHFRPRLAAFLAPGLPHSLF